MPRQNDTKPETHIQPELAAPLTPNTPTKPAPTAKQLELVAAYDTAVALGFLPLMGGLGLAASGALKQAALQAGSNVDSVTKALKACGHADVSQAGRASRAKKAVHLKHWRMRVNMNPASVPKRRKARVDAAKLAANRAIASGKIHIPKGLKSRHSERYAELVRQRGRMIPETIAPLWRIILTVPQGEVRASINLEDRGFTTYLPTCSTLRLVRLKGRKDEKRLVVSPLFPGYLFLADTGRLDFGRVESTEGVASVLRVNHQPYMLPGAIVAHIATKQAVGEFDAKPDAGFTVGQTVMIKGGPMAGRPLKIIRMDPGKFVEGLIAIFGTMTPMRISDLQNVG